MAGEVCHQNIYGFYHCWHGTFVDRDWRTQAERDKGVKLEFVLQHQVCCWCGKPNSEKHGLHLPKEERRDEKGATSTG